MTAFKDKDLHALDELVHADALFVLPDGRTVTKAEGRQAQSMVSGEDLRQ